MPEKGVSLLKNAHSLPAGPLTNWWNRKADFGLGGFWEINQASDRCDCVSARWIFEAGYRFDRVLRRTAAV